MIHFKGLKFKLTVLSYELTYVMVCLLLWVCVW